MTEFIYLYRGGEQPKSPAEGQETMQKWMAWMKELGEKGHLKAVGSPLERTGASSTPISPRSSTRRVSRARISWRGDGR